MTFSFSNLNLANVDVGSGAERLAPGRYAARITDAELRETKSGGNAVVVKFTDVDGRGTIQDFINVNVPKSSDATRIGLERLKSLLVHGGHKNPDNPRDIKSLKGLIVGIRVVDEEYTDKDGNKRNGSKIKSYLALEASEKPESSAPAKGADLDDEIPF